MNMREVVIVEAVRTPIGRRNGKLKDIHPVVLGSLVLKEIVKRAGIAPDQVEDVVFGCVTQAGEQSLNIARSAWLTAGFPVTTPGDHCGQAVRVEPASDSLRGQPHFVWRLRHHDRGRSRVDDESAHGLQRDLARIAVPA